MFIKIQFLSNSSKKYWCLSKSDYFRFLNFKFLVLSRAQIKLFFPAIIKPLIVSFQLFIIEGLFIDFFVTRSENRDHIVFHLYNHFMKYWVLTNFGFDTHFYGFDNTKLCLQTFKIVSYKHNIFSVYRIKQMESNNS